jgi:hypothetical protein
MCDLQEIPSRAPRQGSGFGATWFVTTSPEPSPAAIRPAPQVRRRAGRVRARDGIAFLPYSRVMWTCSRFLDRLSMSLSS